MKETTEAQQTVEEAGSTELIRVPVWEAMYSLSDNPEELAHLICCRDRQCPIDQRECPPDDEVHRMIDERVSP